MPVDSWNGRMISSTVGGGAGVLGFPADYDGIIAGAPMFSMQENVPQILGHARMQLANPLTQESLQLLDDASTGACDALDGVTVGVMRRA